LKKALIAIGIATCTSCAGNLERNQTSSDDRRNAVENGLRLRVQFDDEDHRFSIQQSLRRNKVPGVAIAVLKDGKLDWTAAYGLADIGTGRAVSTATLFQAASLSKPVTALAALRMREVNLIDFDRDISSYLKHFELPKGLHTQSNPVTFRNLLSHTSGVVAGGYLGYSVNAPLPTDLQTLEGRSPAETVPAQVVTEPGSQLAYSGQGYTIVEQALQDFTQQSFQALIQQWVFEPLGMGNATFAQPLPANKHHQAALGYRPDATQVPGGWRIHPEQAAGGLWSTAQDLALVLLTINSALKNGSNLLSQETAMELFREQLDGHAYGLILRGEGRERSVRHFGGNEGYRSMMILYPEIGGGAVFLTNSDLGHAVIGEIARAISQVYDWPDYKQIHATRFSLDHTTVKRYVGHFRFEEGIEVQTAYNAETNSLSIEFPNGDIYQLVPTGPSNFIDPATAVTVDFDDLDHVKVYGDTGVRVTK